MLVWCLGRCAARSRAIPDEAATRKGGCTSDYIPLNCTVHAQGGMLQLFAARKSGHGLLSQGQSVEFGSCHSAATADTSSRT